MRYDEAQFERSLKPLPPLPGEERDFYNLHAGDMMVGAFATGFATALFVVAARFGRPLWMLLFVTVALMGLAWAGFSSATLREGFREAHTYPPRYEVEGGFITFTGEDT